MLPTDRVSAPLAQKLEANRRDDNHSVDTSCSATDTGRQDASNNQDDQPDFSFLEQPLGPDELGYLGYYRVIRLLGRGGMGIVFLAEDPKLRRLVALKVMRPDLAPSSMARERFLHEARATANIRSDHVVAIHEIGQANDLPYIVTEFLQGNSLDRWLKDNPCPTVIQILDLGLQIAHALEACHEAGVIHRDIKPENIWVEDRSNRIKLLDFGVAKGKDLNLTQAGAVIGTPAYMAPEQAQGRAVDERCDLYSLGCVLYEATTGGRNFADSSTAPNDKSPAHPKASSSADSNLPHELSDLIARLLARDPAARPCSAKDVVEILEKIRDALLTEEPTPTRVPVPAKQSTGGQMRAGVLTGAVIAFAATIVLAACKLWIPGLAKNHEPSPIANAKASGLGAISADEIWFGMTAPLSGPKQELGHALEVGIRTCFNQVNDAGGVGERKLQLAALDDRGQTDQVVANLAELCEPQRVFAMIGNVGFPAAEQAVAQASARPMVLFSAFSGAAILRDDPPDRYVFNFRPSGAQETAALVSYLLRARGFRAEQIAVVAEDNGDGAAAFAGVANVLRKQGRLPGQIVRISEAGLHGNGLQQLLAHPEIRAIVLAVPYPAAVAAIRHLRQARDDLVFASVSLAGSDALAKDLSTLGPRFVDGVIISQVVPLPTSPLSTVAKYRRALHKYYPHERPGFGSLEGYINASLLVDGLRNAGDNLTTETLVNALEKLDQIDLGLGTPLHYSAVEHQASHRIWGTVLDGAGHFQPIELE